MKAAKSILASVIATNVLANGALAQNDVAGMITQINRLNGTVAIQQIQDNTVGASTGGPTEEFKVQDGKLLDAVHAGDRVTYSLAGNGSKTITKLQKR
ncbi:copper-binding protein [Bradyrhizobium sp. ARR65]|uniref:copper-binding protein n=1 Tax=Bradyrhizobium sp. ARR65 TaxID=1040989 RepID=UPI0004675AC4|nr:copper-binding protein [Bradyrhizobium sp. ARR65]